jgi:hypothetical protein
MLKSTSLTLLSRRRGTISLRTSRDLAGLCNVSRAVLLFSIHSDGHAHGVTGPWEIVVGGGSFVMRACNEKLAHEPVRGMLLNYHSTLIITSMSL